jgi:hypothetical protein
MSQLGPISPSLLYWLNDRSYAGVSELAQFGPFDGMAIVLYNGSNPEGSRISQYNVWGAVPTLEDVVLPP